MQTHINYLRETLKMMQKSYDDALNQSQTAELLLNTKLSISEALIRDQLENNMKQRFDLEIKSINIFHYFIFQINITRSAPTEIN